MAMPAALRPMKLGEILDQGFTIYRKNFWVFAGIGALPAVMLLAIECCDVNWWHLNSIVNPVRPPGTYLWGMLVSLIYFHINAIFVYLVTPAYVRLVSGVLFEQKTSIFSSLRAPLKDFRRYALLALLKFAFELIGPEAVAVGLFIGLGYGGEAIGMFEPVSNGFMVFMVLTPTVLGVVLFLWMSSSFSLAVPTAAVEQMPVWRSMTRSWQLSKGGRGALVSAWIVVTLVMWVLNLATWVVVRSLVRLIFFRTHFLHLSYLQIYRITFYGLHALASTALGPVLPIILVLLYYNQRVHKEGYDVERMIEAAGLAEPAPAPATEPTPTVVEVPISQSEPGGESIA
jgi:hypothetical protein